MGKILYNCWIDPNNLDSFLNSTKLPLTLKKCIKEKLYDQKEPLEKLRKYYEKKNPNKKFSLKTLFSKKSSKGAAEEGAQKPPRRTDRPCWLISVVDDFKSDKRKITSLEEDVYNPGKTGIPPAEKMVSVWYYADNGAEVKKFITYWLEKTFPEFDLSGKSIESIKKEVLEQVNKSVKTKYADIEALKEMDDKTKVKVIIFYKLLHA